VPNGSGRVQLGLVQSPAINFLARPENPNEANESHGDAGSSEGGFNDQTLLENLSSMNGRVTNYEALGQGRGIVWDTVAHHLSVNGDPAFTSNGHAVQAQSDSGIGNAMQGPLVIQVSFRHAFEPDQVVDGTLEDEVAIGLTNFDLDGNSAAPRSNRTSADLQILDLNKVPLFPFQPLPQRFAEGFDFVLVSVFASAGELSEDSESQYDRSLFQHSDSLGHLTVPPDYELVNQTFSF
jgi:hypothetical protein